MPTITHEFYITREPFLEWTPESEAFIATVQHVFNLSFPNVSHTISVGDRIALTVRVYFLPLLHHYSMIPQAYDRIKTRKSKIASSVLVLVQEFFDRTAFRDKQDKIREYVRWAVRPDGPAYYANPTPQDCRVNHAHPDYIVRFKLPNNAVFDMRSAT
jgi:hypothetical protein